MITVYFIRHAEAVNTVRDGRARPLTEKGLADRRLVTEFLRGKSIDAVLSSPFKRAVDTVADFADWAGLPITTVEDFRERRSDSDWRRDTDFIPLIERQWADFSYTLSDGECLAAVQERNIAALHEALARHEGQTIVIGTHGTALSTILNYYDPSYGFSDFMDMAERLPWAVKMLFDGTRCASLEKIDLFRPAQPLGDADCEVRKADIGTLGNYRFVVIFSRCRDQWLYCRAKERDTYETAGGHVEPGETPLEAAKRELFEETGAVRFDIRPAFDYSVHGPAGDSNGQAFFAQIQELGPLPNYEMAEVRLFDTIPEKMRFPRLLPLIYDMLQQWLNQ